MKQKLATDRSVRILRVLIDYHFGESSLASPLSYLFRTFHFRFRPQRLITFAQYYSSIIQQIRNTQFVWICLYILIHISSVVYVCHLSNHIKIWINCAKKIFKRDFANLELSSSFFKFVYRVTYIWIESYKSDKSQSETCLYDYI